MTAASPPTSKTSLKEARRLYKAKDRKTIAAHHRIVEEHPVLDVLLAFCVEYSLDPLGGHVWLVDENFDRPVAENGEPAAELRGTGVELKVGVTRDGLLFVANRDERFGGMEFDVVRAKDTFKAKRDGGDVHITHEYPDLPDDATGDGDNYRGEVVGAYCKTFVDGRKPTYYFAFLSEHGQFDGDQLSGTWATYISAMILKAAQSVTLRLALGISGIVGLDEIKRGDAPEPERESSPPPSPEGFLAELNIDPEVKATLIEEVNAANEAEPNSWSLAKLQMRLGVTDPSALEEAVSKVLGEIDDFFDARKTRAAAAS